MGYTENKYDIVRTTIKSWRNLKVAWDKIDFALKDTEEGLSKFLQNKIRDELWDDSINNKVWHDIVQRFKSIEERSETNIFLESSLISNGENLHNYSTPLEETNAWFHYKNKLLKEYKFSIEATEEIEKTTTRILNRLKPKTQADKPNKGLVIGNVQSGKTANMVALMTMAADWGWNFFIIFSGTIDNLRQQTLNRLRNDLRSDGSTIEWNLYDQLSHKNSNQLQDMNLSSNNRSRYYTVVLKNKTRLNNLVRWLNKDLNKKQQLKVLIIDDEADQAGVNTASIAESELSAINKSIKQIIFNKDHKNKPTNKGYFSMNYIGYTATPYANVLNESPDDPESFFPDDFVATLQPSNEYFGPKQFFGYEENDPIDFINIIPNDHIKKVSLIHKGESNLLPESLKEAIAWFYCSVGLMRYKQYKKPLSMLIHTSQRVNTHKRISEAITKYLTKTSHDDLLSFFETIYIEQSSKVTVAQLNEMFPEYPSEGIKDLPPFSEFRDQVQYLIKEGLTNILIDQEGDLEYSRKVHLCIDNSSSNTFTLNENAHVRLKYPNKTDNLDYASAFIVVGGSTLSRGLTIEGLVSTYFFRTVTQADTLMQMARWFGYRRGYELLPRVWMSNITFDRFSFLTQLDAELRSTIYWMDTNALRPAEFGVKIKNSPKPSFMRVTSKNKMQSAMEIDIDYIGTQHQTINFYSEKEKLYHNKNTATRFIEYLNKNNKANFKSYSTIWKDVDYLKVFDFLNELDVPETPSKLDYKLLKKWYETSFNKSGSHNWNVIFAGTAKGKNVNLGGHSVYTVNRSKFPDKEDGIIRLGVLRTSSDVILDVDRKDMPEHLYELYDNFKLKNIDIVRNKAKLNKTPLLVIYLVDKDSYPQRANTSRVKLDALDHLIGTFIYIPTGDEKTSYSSKLKVRLNNANELEEEVDEITS